MTGLRNNSGVVLMAAVMLIVFAAVCVLGVSHYVSNRLKQNAVEVSELKAKYLAQGGIHAAIYWYRYNGYITPGTQIVDANNYAVHNGTSAGHLAVDSSGARWTASGRNLSGLEANSTTGGTVYIDRMVVSWAGVPLTRRLQVIRMNGSDVWSGTAASPANCDLVPDVAVWGTPKLNINYLRFNSSMNTPSTTVTISFYLTDGTVVTVQVYPAGSGGSSGVCTVQASGKNNNEWQGVSIYKSIQADYDPATGKITNYAEIDTEIT